MSKTKLMLGDNLDNLKKLPDNSIDSVVTDPPYGLSFMNKKWDYNVPSVDFWKEVYRVLKPGGHILSFGGTRTYHRMVINIEDAGFEIRDQIMWLYGSGFPKSHNIGKAVDKQNGIEIPKNKMRVVNSVGIDNYDDSGKGRRYDSVEYEAKNDFEGWGTALKPANEPICLARKPLSEKSVAENVLKWKTGGINVDGCRVGSEGEGRFPSNIILECICDNVIKGEKGEIKKSVGRNSQSLFNGNKKDVEYKNFTDKGDIHTNPNCPCYLLDEQSGVGKSSPFIANNTGYVSGSFTDDNKRGFGYNVNGGYSDKGGASRFFYQAKVSKSERNMGLDGFEAKLQAGAEFRPNHMKKALNGEDGNPYGRYTPTKNNHPTVKPINLMAYLCRLITPKNGIVLDPFMGSGSTGISAQLEGFRFVGMEMDEDYFKIASKRIENFEEYRKFIK